jgi:DNA (cytosine-5)-methyltransferase 1
VSTHRASRPPKSTLTVVDLFAGCGGLSQGFRETSRFTPVGAVEHDLAAAATYAANFGEDHVYCGDIAQWVQSDLTHADVVIGGPPCQGFSNLGAKRDDDERNDLWERYVDALVKIKPKAFLIENVDRFLKTRQFSSLQAAVQPDGVLSDYRVAWGILRATDFGAAQLRKRAIIIGTHKSVEQINLPVGTVPRQQWQTVKDVLSGINPKVPLRRTELPAGRTHEVFGKIVRGRYTAEELHVTRRYESISRQRFRRIPEGGNRFNLPDRLKAPCWIKHTSGSGDVMGRLVWDKPSVTIRTEFFKPEKGRYLHPDEHRALTHHEAARLQGFPDTFEWCGSKIEIARQIGNAVPVPLAKALGKHIAEHLLSS